MTDAGWALVVRAQAGDRDALAQLYAENHPAVLAYVMHRLGPIGRGDDAQDIAHEVWVRALSKLTSLQWQGRPFGAWLYTIAGNLVRDYVRSHRFRRSTTDEVPDMPAGGMSLDDHVVTGELARTVRAALAQLTADQRAVIEHRFYHDRSISETAAALGIHEGAVKARQYRACLQLAKLSELANPHLTAWARTVAPVRAQ